MVKKVLYAEGSLLLCCRATQQLEATSQLEVSKFGMMLQRNIFKRITGAGLSDQCQRFNYVFTEDICELSSRTKEARPEDYIPNPERFYFKRGEFNCLSTLLLTKNGKPPTKVLTEMLWVTPSPLAPPSPPPSPKNKINKKLKWRQKKQLNIFVNGK